MFNTSRFTKNVHISWLISAASIGLITGAAIAPRMEYKFASLNWALVVLPLLLVVCMRRKMYIIPLAVLVGLAFGLCRASVVGQADLVYSQFYGQQVKIIGHVSEDTSYGPKGDQRMRLDGITLDQKELSGTIWVSFTEKTTIKRGDIVTLSGLLSKGFGNTPASVYRASIEDVQRPYPGDVGRRARDGFGEGVHRTMTEFDANFALAFLLGQKLALPEGLSDQLKTIGLIHAVVASGYHLTVLVGVVRRLFVKISKYLTFILSSGMIIGFIFITGFSPSMTRAGLVTGLSLIAWYYGRLIHPVVLLSFTAAITVLYKPQYVWGDVGWLLSFAAFSGVIILAPLLNHYFWGNSKPSLLREILVVTFAAQLVTLPITMQVFGYYSVYGLLANLLVVPLVPLIMLSTFVAGLFGLLFTPIGLVFGKITEVLLAYVTMMVGWVANLPGSKTEVTFTSVMVIISYLLIGLISLFLWRKTGHNFKSNKDVLKPF